MAGHLIPESDCGGARSNDLNVEYSFGSESCGLVRKALESGDEQSCNHDHDETKCYLYDSDRVHQTPPRDRTASSLDCSGRIDCRCTKRGDDTKENRYSTG